MSRYFVVPTTAISLTIAIAYSIKAKGQLDFTDPAAVMQLTKTLLDVNFDLRIELPADRLCPPVPNRHNYILWLKDLMDTTSYDQPGRGLCGIDIGTGASCIYSLLGCAQRPWSFISTDIDEKSLSYAAKNVKLNHLESRITVVARKKTDPLVCVDVIADSTQVGFVMTNPPFYESEEELWTLAKKKSRPPYSACTGAPVEMVCEGGEVAFVGRILMESLQLRDRVQWYTSMLGKVSSLEVLVERLRKEGIDNYAVTEFIQGNKTRRWAIAWSFAPMRPAEHVARGMQAVPWRKILPQTVEMDVVTSKPGEAGMLATNIDSLMQSLDLASWTWDKPRLQGIGRAREKVWSRAWRRRKQRGETIIKGACGVSVTCTFGFSITLRIGLAEAVVVCRWLEGHDFPTFESFNGFLKSRLAAKPTSQAAAKEAPVS